MISFRLSDTEKALISERARAEGLSISEYCRMILTGPVLQISPNMPSTPVVLKPPGGPPTGQTIQTQRPSALPPDLLIELKTVLQKYYVE